MMPICVLVQRFCLVGRWWALILFAWVSLADVPRCPVLQSLQRTPRATRLRPLPGQPPWPQPHSGESVNRRGLGVARGSHRESPKEQGMCQALSTPEFPRTPLVSCRGEEGPCEYLIIRPGSENFMSHMPARTVCPASYVTAELWAGRPEPGRASREGPSTQQSKTKASWTEPDTWAPGSSQTPAGSRETKGSQLPWLGSRDLTFSPRWRTPVLGMPQGAFLTDRTIHTHAHTHSH